MLCVSSLKIVLFSKERKKVEFGESNGRKGQEKEGRQESMIRIYHTIISSYNHMINKKIFRFYLFYV